MGRSAALADQGDAPAGAADAGEGQGGGRGAGDPPAGHRRRGLAERIGAGLAPAPQQQSRRPALLGGELEPAAGGHRHPPRLADQGGEAAVAHPLLHHRQYLLVVAAFGVEQAVRRQPGQSKTGGEQVRAGQRPEHLAAGARGDREARGERGEEQGRGGVVAGGGRSGGDLVQPAGQPAAGEPVVDLGEAEGEARPPLGAAGAGAFDRAHLGPQGGETRIQSRGKRHTTRTHLFMLCSPHCPEVKAPEHGVPLKPARKNMLGSTFRFWDHFGYETYHIWQFRHKAGMIHVVDHLSEFVRYLKSVSPMHLLAHSGRMTSVFLTVILRYRFIYSHNLRIIN